MKKTELKQTIKEEIKKTLKENKKLNRDLDYEQFRESDEMGWMEVTMEDIAEQSNLDLEYRDDFNEAFDEAIKILKANQPNLNFGLIKKFRENMF